MGGPIYHLYSGLINPPQIVARDIGIDVVVQLQGPQKPKITISDFPRTALVTLSNT